MQNKTTLTAAFAATLLACQASPALAELPAPVRAMIEKAQQSDDIEAMEVVIDLADETFPGNSGELDAIMAAYRTRVEAKLAVEAADEAAAEEAAIRNAGLFDNWSGRGELGAFNSTGNSSNTGITAALALTREGINWRHKLRARADYQRSNGVTTREQFLAAYEPNLKLSDRLYVYALAQYERDRFQGFSARYSASGGLGYDVIDSEDMTLSVQAGPAYRRTERINGTTDSSIAGLASADFDWQIAENIALTQDASAFMQSGNSTYTSATGIQAGIADNVKLRLSYTVEHDTQPPVGSDSTDTLSRVTIIYDF